MWKHAVCRTATCEVYGGAYVDEDRLVLKRNGVARFRYLQGRGETLSLSVTSEGRGELNLFINGKTAAALSLQNGEGKAPISLPEGVWELGLCSQTAGEIRLKTIRMQRI